MTSRRSFLIGSVGLPFTALSLNSVQASTFAAIASSTPLESQSGAMPQESSPERCCIRSWDHLNTGSVDSVYLSFSSSWKIGWH